MSGRGVFAVDRGVFDHPIFAPEPYTEREAWLWMLAAAAWKARRVRVGKAVIDLARGQLSFATRFMAGKWKWAHSRVVRFLKRLEIDTMVTTQTTRQSTLITICNYDRYAFDRNTDETPIDTPSDTRPEHSRNKDKESKKDKKEYTGAFEEFWKSYPGRDGANPKAPAEKLFFGFVKAGENPDAIIAGAKRCAVRESKNIGTPYIPQAVKWLRDKRWLDYGDNSQANVLNIRGSFV